MEEYRQNRATSNRRSPWVTSDVVILVHFGDIDRGPIVGIAYQYGMCSARTAVVQVRKSELVYIKLIKKILFDYKSFKNISLSQFLVTKVEKKSKNGD